MRPTTRQTPFRTAVSKARTALVEQIKGLRVREEFRLRPREDDLKNEVLRKQKEVAKVIGELTEVLDDLKKADEMREGEPKRWQADYDYVLARLELELAWLHEYEFALGELRREERPPLDPKEHTGWRLAPAEVSRGRRVGEARWRAEAVKRLAAGRAGLPGDAVGVVRKARCGGTAGVDVEGGEGGGMRNRLAAALGRATRRPEGGR